jgi:type IX secretion system PorP/SprF family membrane protein
MFNDAVINPAVCGSKQYDVITLISRSQWAGFEGAPKTQLLGYNKQQGNNMGLGAVLFNDVTGPISRTGTQLSYAYNVDISSTYKLSFGLSASVFQFLFDGNKATLHDNTFDPAALGGIEKSLVYDATLGTYLFNENYYFGFSLPQLIQSKINLETDKNNLKRHYFFTSGYNYTINNQFDILPSVMLKSTDASPLQFDLNLRAIYNKNFWTGLSYRNQDAVVIMLGMDYENYSFGYSFDRTISDINSYTAGSHGFMISYKIREKENALDTLEVEENKEEEIVEEAVATEIKYVELTDTLVVTKTITDTIYLTDTLYLNECDTVFVDNYIYDTIYMDNYIYDTTYVDVKDDRKNNAKITPEQLSILDTVLSNLELASNKAEITFDSYGSLERLVTMLMDNPSMRLRIEGHTDNVGSDYMNMELSKARAKKVTLFLTDRGIVSNRIITLYYGEDNPITTNETEEGRSKNRRVELTIFFD